MAQGGWQVITKERLAELRNDIEVGWSDPIKTRYKDFKELLETIESLLRVAEAAEVAGESLEDLLYHGIRMPNGAVHESNRDVAKQSLEDLCEALQALRGKESDVPKTL